MHPRVKAYLQEQGNRCDVTTYAALDRCGRFVLPMDMVVFGYRTDEGPEILVWGDVVNYEGTAHIAARTKMAVCKIAVSECIRLPAYGSVLYALVMHYFRQVNIVTVQQYGDLHINGQPLLDRLVWGC